ncbi:MAG: hypothetical protein ABIE25_09055 [Thermoplasmatota archaeon]|nr:hypothetical protein [Candidatus Thermoplasmatota archaeon]
MVLHHSIIARLVDASLAGLGRALSLAIDLNFAHLYGYDISGDGYMIAFVSAATVILRMALPVFVGHRGDWFQMTIRDRLLTVRARGLHLTGKPST